MTDLRKKKVAEYLCKYMYPDIDLENNFSSSEARSKQFNRDIETILNNYDFFKECIDKDDPNISSELFKLHYENYLEMFFPGFKKMDVPKQEACEMRSGICLSNLKEIDALFHEMKDPASTLYIGNLYSDKEIVKIASIYSSLYSNTQKQIGEPTDKVDLIGDYTAPGANINNCFERIFTYRDQTEAERNYALESAVEQYNSKITVKLSKLLPLIIKNKNITLDKAMAVKEFLDSALNPPKEIIERLEK